MPQRLPEAPCYWDRERLTYWLLMQWPEVVSAADGGGVLVETAALEPEPFASDSADAGVAVKGQSLTSVPGVDRLPANVVPEQTHTAVTSVEVVSIVMLILTSVQGTYHRV